MRENRKSGSVGAPGGKPPGATRPAALGRWEDGVALRNLVRSEALPGWWRRRWWVWFRRGPVVSWDLCPPPVCANSTDRFRPRQPKVLTVQIACRF